MTAREWADRLCKPTMPAGFRFDGWEAHDETVIGYVMGERRLPAGDGFPAGRFAYACVELQPAVLDDAKDTRELVRVHAASAVETCRDLEART